MFDFLKGKVVSRSSDYIVIEVNDKGYSIIVSNPLDYELNTNYKIYVYDTLKNESLLLYGFKNNEIKQLFLKIITVKGVGPKTAITMFRDYDEKTIIKAINENNTNFLKSLPNVGLKGAKQIILDLKGKLVDEQPLNNDLLDIKEALKGLGFKVNDIDKVLNELNKENHNVDDYMKLALTKLNKIR